MVLCWLRVFSLQIVTHCASLSRLFNICAPYLPLWIFLLVICFMDDVSYRLKQDKIMDLPEYVEFQ